MSARLPLLTVALIVLAGCSRGLPPDDASMSSWMYGVDLQISGAEAAGAAPEQLKVLHQIRDTGEITWAEVDSAMQETFRCFEAAGIEYQVDNAVGYNGLKEPGYSFSAGTADPATFMEVGDRCIAQHSKFIEAAYTLRPEAVEADNRYLETLKPALIACLEDNGVAVDKEATFDELARLAYQLYGPVASGAFQKTDASGNGNTWTFIGVPASPPDASPVPHGPDCLGVAFSSDPAG